MTTRTRPGTRVRAAVALATLLLTGGVLAGCSDEPDAAPSPSPSASQEATESPDAMEGMDHEAHGMADPLTYEGQTGKTALELLQVNDPQAEVTGEGDQAYVVGIGGHAADESKNEFWALYVNGEQAQVGAGALETKDGDEIEWKLETY